MTQHADFYIEMDGSNYSFRHRRYVESVVNRIKADGFTLFDPLDKIHDYMGNPARWKPETKSFKDRVALLTKALKGGGIDAEQEAPIEDIDCAAIPCMRMGCTERRARPFTHNVKVWKKVDKEAIEPLYDERLRGLLNTRYQHEAWKERNLEYGINLCYMHYEEIMSLIYGAEVILEEAKLFLVEGSCDEKTREILFKSLTEKAKRL